MSSEFTFSGYQHVGGRSYQEDDRLFDSTKINGKHVTILAVADGMGGYRAGDIASSLAIKEARRFFASLTSPNMDFIKKGLARVFERANQAIEEYANNHLDDKGLGTTFTCAVIVEDQMVVAHIGDSRAYVLSGKNTYLCTRDHTAYQEAKEIGIDVSRINVGRNALSRCLDGGEDYWPDIEGPFKVKNSLVFICSDGLYNVLPELKLHNIAADSEDANAFVKNAVQEAVQKGAKDNVTVVSYSDHHNAHIKPRKLIKKKRRLSIKRAAVLLAFVFALGTTIYGLYGFGYPYGGQGDIKDEDPNALNQSAGSESNYGTNNELPISEYESDDEPVSLEAEAGSSGDFNTMPVTFEITPSNADVMIESRDTGNKFAKTLSDERVMELPEGSYSVTVRAEGYIEKVETFDVWALQADEHYKHAIQLDPVPPTKGSLEFKIRPENAAVVLVSEETEEELELSASTDKPVSLNAGRYAYTISADQHESQSGIISIEPGETFLLNEDLVNAEVEITAVPEATLTDSAGVTKYYLQLVNIKESAESANKKKSELENKLAENFELQLWDPKTMNNDTDGWKIVMGPFDNEEEARNAIDQAAEMMGLDQESDPSNRPFLIEIRTFE